MSTAMPQAVMQDLRNLEGCDRAAVERLMPTVYEDLRALASRLLHHERCDHTLEPTALVHEAYLSLAGRPNAPWHDQAHFYRVAAIAMRHILINHARDRRRLKRGGDNTRVSLSQDRAEPPSEPVDLLELDEALRKLAAFDQRKVMLLELRYFGGISVDRCAEILGISATTVKRDWAFAKAWLARELA